MAGIDQLGYWPPVWSASAVSPTGTTARPPAGPHPAGNNRTAAARPSSRRHRKQPLSIDPACRKVRQADAHSLPATGATSLHAVMVHSCHDADEGESAYFGGGQNAPHAAAARPGSLSRNP